MAATARILPAGTRALTRRYGSPHSPASAKLMAGGTSPPPPRAGNFSAGLLCSEKHRKPALEDLDCQLPEIRPVPWSSAADRLRAIRRAVFVAEQGIPETLEFGDAEADRRARHWLALADGGEPVGCVRLLGDRLGRLAVLPEQRGRGIGAALVRRVIRDALDQGLDRLYLHAQSEALGFYERLGFAAAGGEFIEAGRPHRRMVYDLGRLRPARDLEPPAVDPADRVRQPLAGTAALAAGAVALIPTALRRLRILGNCLDPEIYAAEPVGDALLAFATGHPQAEVRVLIRDPEPLIHGSHRLVKLARRLPSLIRLRQLPAGAASPADELLVTDGGALLCWQNGRPPVGYAIRHAPREARRLAEDFDALWDQGREIAELRELRL